MTQVFVKRLQLEIVARIEGEDAHDAELMEESSRGMNAAMAVALVAFVAALLLALAGGAL